MSKELHLFRCYNCNWADYGTGEYGDLPPKDWIKLIVHQYEPPLTAYLCIHCQKKDGLVSKSLENGHE